MSTAVSLFSGGGLADVGLKAAGFDVVGAVEIDEAVAGVYRDNLGDHIVCAPVEAVDPRRWEGVDLLWASPPCQQHSVARSKSLPARKDADAGLAVVDWVLALRPRWVIVENVPGYRNAPSFHAICACLRGLGYFLDYGNVNFADMGVPQTRRRLILRACRDSLVPPLPPPVPWVGWYAAIEDLIPTLPESRFAPWQLARLPQTLPFFAGLADGDNAGRRSYVEDNAPLVLRSPGEPAYTTRTNNTGRAFLCGPSTVNGGRGAQIAEACEPWDTVRTGTNHLASTRAFLVHGTSTLDVRQAEGSSACVMATVHEKAAKPRAFLVAGDAEGPGRLNVRAGEEPAYTMKANTGTGRLNPHRAWLEQGRVVSMTPRALARFQSVPDSYTLPTKAALACRVIGDGVPPLAAEILARGLRLASYPSSLFDGFTLEETR